MTDTETEMPEGVTADDVKTIRAFCRAMGWPEPDVTPDFIELLGGELELHRGTIDIVVPYPGAKTAETIKARACRCARSAVATAVTWTRPTATWP